MKEYLLTEIVNAYPELKQEYLKWKKWYEMTEQELIVELCFCLLSSQVPYEQVRSVISHLDHQEYLTSKWILTTPDVKKRMAQELSKPIYDPQRKNGKFRKYRFPNKGADYIVDAIKTFYEHDLGIIYYLKNFSSDIHARRFLVKNIRGLGPKEASHFLRNVRYSETLAIIDVHVVSFMHLCELIPNQVKSIDMNQYLKLEVILQDFARQLNMNLSILDMVIWNVMRQPNISQEWNRNGRAAR